jgi:hypothetical protein
MPDSSVTNRKSFRHLGDEVIPERSLPSGDKSFDVHITP